MDSEIRFPKNMMQFLQLTGESKGERNVNLSVLKCLKKDQSEKVYFI